MKELIKKILKEDYSPAGKEIIPNEIVVHKSNPIFRNNIMSEGLKVMAGECYKIYAGYGEKCIPAIFATNSKNKRSWFESTYDDDIWFIDTTKIPEVKWFKDRHYESTKKHIVTFQDIPRDAITLFYEGTGKSDEFVVESEIKDDIQKNIKVINLILNEISWDGLCEIWVEYNKDDSDYEIRSKSIKRHFDHDEIVRELDYLDNTLKSMGLRTYIYTPWYVEECEDEVEFLNESEEETNYTTIIKNFIKSFYLENDTIKDIQVFYHDVDDFYEIVILFDIDKINEKYFYDFEKLHYLEFISNEIQKTVKGYFSIDELDVNYYF